MVVWEHNMCIRSKFKMSPLLQALNTIVEKTLKSQFSMLSKTAFGKVLKLPYKYFTSASWRLR